MPLILMVLCIGIFTLSQAIPKESTANKSKYQFFQIKTTSNYWLTEGGRGGGRTFMVSYNFLTNIEKHKEEFYIDLKIKEVKWKSSIKLKSSIKIDDTLTIGVLKSDFYYIQSYKTSLIKDAAFSRELDYYWIIKNNKVLFSPNLKYQRELKGYNSDFFLGLIITVSSLIILSAIYYHHRKPRIR